MDFLRNLPPNVQPALIAALASMVGCLVTLLVAWRKIKTQVKLKLREMETQTDLKLRELESLAARLRVEHEGLRQAQLTEILKKRIETYPALYEIITVFGRNWELEGKRQDHHWANSFLKALLKNNARNGAFFSNDVYEQYSKLRTALEELTKALETGRHATNDEMQAVYHLIRGTPVSFSERQAGLGNVY